MADIFDQIENVQSPAGGISRQPDKTTQNQPGDIFDQIGNQQAAQARARTLGSLAARIAQYPTGPGRTVQEQMESGINPDPGFLRTLYQQSGIPGIVHLGRIALGQEQPSHPGIAGGPLLGAAKEFADAYTAGIMGPLTAPPTGSLLGEIGKGFEAGMNVIGLGTPIAKAASAIGARHPGEAAGTVIPLAAQVLAPEAAEAVTSRLRGASSAGKLAANQQIQAAAGELAAKVSPDAYSTQLSSDLARQAISGERAGVQSTLESMAKNAAGGGSEQTPIEVANATVKALQGQKGFQDLLESKLYPEVSNIAGQKGITVAATKSTDALNQVMQLSGQAQQQMGASTMTPGDLSALAKMQGRMRLSAAAPGEVYINHIEAVAPQNFAMLPASVQQAILEATGDITKGAAVPFGTMQESARGIGKMVRQLQGSGNPEAASRIFVLKNLQGAMNSDLESALSNEPQLLDTWKTAKNLTQEQHEAIDQNIIKGYFTNPRNQPAAEAIVEKILGPGNYREIQDVARGITVGPATEEAASKIGTPEIAQKLADTVADNTAAKAQVSRLVLDTAIKQATSPSKTPGVTAPVVDYNRAVKFLENRPGTEILMGDSYNNSLNQLRDMANSQLMQQDPQYGAFLQRVAKGIPQDQFARDLTTRPDFASRMSQLAPDDMTRTKLARTIVDDVLDRSMQAGTFGSPDSFMDARKFASNLKEAGPSLAEFGSRTAVNSLKAMADAIEQQSLSSALSLRARIRARIPLISSSAGRLYMTSGPNQMFLITPEQILKATKDPGLASLMARAARGPLPVGEMQLLSTGLAGVGRGEQEQTAPQNAP